VHRYEERYAEAAADYRRAAQLDPSLPAIEALRSMEQFLGRVAGLVAARGHLKPKKIAQLLEAFHPHDPTNAAPTAEPRTEQEAADAAEVSGEVPVRLLEQGVNGGKVVALKLIAHIGPSDFPPT
jgi:hypothetical protein